MDYSVGDPGSRLRSIPPRLLGFPCLLPRAGWFAGQGSKVLQFTAATICQARNEFNRAAAQPAVWSLSFPGTAAPLLGPFLKGLVIERYCRDNPLAPRAVLTGGLP